MFGDVKSAAGQKTLNEFLGDRSYIEGYNDSVVELFKTCLKCWHSTSPKTILITSHHITWRIQKQASKGLCF